MNSNFNQVKPMSTLVSIRNLHKTYQRGPEKVDVLRGIDLDIIQGDFVALMGPSGSGKTTLLNLIGGLDSPSSGSIEVAGQHIETLREGQLAQWRSNHVGFVFQFYNLIPSLTVRENVALVTDIAPHPMPIDEAIALVGLTPRQHHFPAQLSGGEQQRVAIARAIAKRPVVMLCDEPTGALDSATGVHVLEALERVNLDMGTTTVVITHNVDIARMAHRVLYMADGRIGREQVNAERLPARELHW